MKEIKNTVIIVNYNSSIFIELSLFALFKLSNIKHSIIIADNGSRDEDLFHLISISKKYNNVLILPRQQKESASMAHGKALEHLLNYVETPYVTVLDADATFLLKGWDSKIISYMKKDVCAIGSPLTIATGVNTNKYIDFPYMFSAVYKTEILKSISHPFLPTQGKETIEDTGWKIRQYCKENNLQGLLFTGYNTRNYKNGPFYSVICSEYYWKDKLISSHFGRGSSDGEAKYLKKLHLPILGPWLKKKKGQLEAKKWISLCYNIVKQQVSS